MGKFKRELFFYTFSDILKLYSIYKKNKHIIAEKKAKSQIDSEIVPE